MEKEPNEQAIRAAAFSEIQPIYDEDHATGYWAGIGILQRYGFSRDKAEDMMTEYSLIAERNTLPGSIKSLPLFDSEMPPTQEQMQFDQLHLRAAYFTLGYVEDATERADQSAIFLGNYWLGNSTEDTRELLEGFKENPSEVVNYVKWAFNDDPSLENMLTEFSERAEKGMLRPPSFE